MNREVLEWSSKLKFIPQKILTTISVGNEENCHSTILTVLEISDEVDSSEFIIEQFFPDYIQVVSVDQKANTRMDIWKDGKPNFQIISLDELLDYNRKEFTASHDINNSFYPSRILTLSAINVIVFLSAFVYFIFSRKG